jgi:PBP1b-binding outer membrane lipoprotein LpoB
MKSLILAFAFILFVGCKEKCDRESVSDNMTELCLKTQDKDFCHCVMDNMNWNFMESRGAHIDTEKCEIKDFDKLILEEDVRKTCSSKKYRDEQ